MPRLSAIGLAVSLLVLTPAPFCAAHAAPPAAAADHALAAQIDAAVAGHFKPDEPGATMVVVRDGKPVFRKAYGMADVAKKLPMEPSMAMRIGSVTKQFTAVAILLLAEEGKLAVTDEITKFFPDYPTQGRKITVEHLLTHTSGIQSYTGKPEFMKGMANPTGVGAMIDSFKNDKMVFEPGTRWAYNNSGYYLLGAIVEKVSGQPYAKFLEQRIFVPLGMTNTAYEGYERGSVAKAAGHTRDGDAFKPGQPIHMSQPYAAGALVSTADDMARWGAAVASGKLLKASSWQQAFTPYKLANGESTNYGYGWETGKLMGNDKVSHGGAINGFKAYTLRVPAKDVFVAVLTNADSGLAGADMVAYKAAAVAMGTPFPQYKPVTLAPAAMDAYVGVYGLDDKTARTIRREEGQLVMQRPGRAGIKLAAWKDDHFFIPDSLSTLEFRRNAKGEVTGLAISSDGGEPVLHPHTGRKPAERTIVKIPNATFDAYLGRYQLAPGFLVEVRRDGDRFIAQATGQKEFELLPLSDNKFYVKAVDAEVRFEKAADGAMQLVLNQNGKEMPGKRI
jgi:CubicO group peptidase (beta-lactamase class C family)